MNKNNHKKKRIFMCLGFLLGAFCSCIALCGCSKTEGYSNQWLFPENVQSVYVEMFASQSFERGVEYKVTDAVAKRIEAGTPYKIISDRDSADSLLSGRINSVGTSVLTAERETGRALEKSVQVIATVNWKDLKTGELLIDNVTVSASASFSEWQNQGMDYATALAANKLGQRIVELMEKQW